MGVTLLRMLLATPLRRPATSTSITESSGSGIGDDGRDGESESVLSSHGSEISELNVCRLAGLGREPYAAKSPEEKKGE